MHDRINAFAVIFAGGPNLLVGFASIVTAVTILRWHKKLVAQTWTFKHEQPPGDRRDLMPRAVTIGARVAAMPCSTPTSKYAGPPPARRRPPQRPIALSVRRTKG